MLVPLLSIGIGIAMGFFIQRVRASSPAMIAKNLRLENLSVIKFMALTMAVGMVLVYGISLVAPQILHFDVKPTYVVGVLLGGLVFGVGFGIAYLEGGLLAAFIAHATWNLILHT